MSVFKAHSSFEMRKPVPGYTVKPTKPAVHLNRPQTQQARQSKKTTVAPVAWVRRFSIEDRLKVDNIHLMPSTSLCSLETTLKTFHAMELVKRIILQHLQRCSTISCWLGLLGAVLAIIDVEITHRSHKSNRDRMQPNGVFTLSVSEITAVAIKSTISFLTVLMCINVYLTYASICKFNIARNVLPDSATIFNSNLLLYYAVESVLCLFHVPPLVDLYSGMSYKFQLFVLVRVYTIARYMKEHNQFTRNKTCLFLASVTRTELSNMFLFKTFLKKMPFKVIVTTYFLNIFLGAYVVYVIEEKDSYLDSTWMVIVTMTTLGYGDVVPVTFLGRFITGIMSVLGIFLMALLISVIHESLQLSQSEKRILAHLENAEHQNMKKEAAARLIQSCWRFHRYIKSNRESLAWKRVRQIARLKKLKNQLYADLHNWREQKRITGDHWYKEFISDDIAMMVTDVARAVDKIQFTLNRLNYAQVQGRRTYLRKDLLRERTIYEEVEERPSRNCETAMSPLDTKLVHTNDICRHVPASENPSVLDYKSVFLPGCSSNESTKNCSRMSPVENSRWEIEQKLESMEDYLDSFYTKAKGDIRQIKKLLQDELSDSKSVTPNMLDKK